MAKYIDRGFWKGMWYYGHESKKLRRHRWVTSWVAIAQHLVFIVTFARYEPEWWENRIAELITNKELWNSKNTE